MDMDQGHLINNWTVKFVVSCCVVSKQVEVSTVLESTGPWLHAGICLPFVHQVILEILHNIIQTHLFILHINQLEYFKRNMDISQELLNTQTTVSENRYIYPRIAFQQVMAGQNCRTVQ